ncbi:hypothetical protein GCM10011613_30250 [Cellvibrio zantedeschiae]|uniref:Solute-binding protein family 3/N-terminal domain-containing protein n=1 Tax=Cellvibrio zantedeschiae TaxID=1237077 RepID=A0ABQ3B7H8_9GAMM|nr:hypothetical protein [Cellvibrio zantedeschiae]GGY83316.1 hypothetical protein GCM10011613_30250 [Cellvibrio zantedeschiae]
MDRLTSKIYTLIMALIACKLACAAEDVTYVSSPQNSAGPMVVSYLKLDDFDAHYAYRYQLIDRALELTRTEFGDYQYQPFNSQSTSIRYAQLLGEGKQINLLWASPGTPISRANAVMIPIDILKGLLGYRACLINKNELPGLEFVTDRLSFDKIKFGQAQWPDREIYKTNRLIEVDAPSFDALFKMLGARRFDCIPLGIDEIEEVYHSKITEYPFLAIDSHLLIYYHYPMYFYVSKKTPELAQRLKLGLQKMQVNGEFNQIFAKHHAQHLAKLDLKKRKLICLNSPYSSDQGDCAIPQVD